ncbi:TMhelix containing protein [Vibrio phage 1.054.O._10N.261.52.A1]|nr:TMhelix containing protein [Vibrio phage 1.054.O._10N.261.52.A1]
MTTRILANISPEEQQAAIDFAKNKPQSTDDMVLGDDAVFEISQHWKKTEEWVKRYLAATFLIILSLTGGVSMMDNDDHNFERVRTTNARKREDI